jgi:hypothetical protein
VWVSRRTCFFLDLRDDRIDVRSDGACVIDKKNNKTESLRTANKAVKTFPRVLYTSSDASPRVPLKENKCQT